MIFIIIIIPHHPSPVCSHASAPAEQVAPLVTFGLLGGRQIVSQFQKSQQQQAKTVQEMVTHLLCHAAFPRLNWTVDLASVTCTPLSIVTLAAPGSGQAATK